MKTFLVTGASRGVGFEICKQAVANGHRAIALSRNISPLKGIPDVHPFSVDLSLESEVVDFVKEISSSFKSIDVLINNAGSLINKPFLEISSSDFESKIRNGFFERFVHAFRLQFEMSFNCFFMFFFSACSMC